MRLIGLFALLSCCGGLALAQAPAIPKNMMDPAEEILAMAMVPNAPFGQDTAPPSPATAPVQTRGPVRISGGVMAGQRLTRVNPVYPDDARANHLEGTVVFSATIGRDGVVQDLKTISGPAAFTQAATDAVRQWTFRPYLLNGQPTEVLTTITVNFHLNTP